MPNPVVHFEICGKDGKKLQDFYSRAFGWHVDTNNPMNYGMVDTHAGGINGGVTADPEGPAVRVYIEVDDPQAYLDKAVKAGANVMMEVMQVTPDTVIAMFADPQGNVTGLLKETAH